MKAQKILSAFLAAVMLLSICVTGASSADKKLPFTDTPEGEWYYDAVKYVYENGLMNGTGDGTKFSPAMNLTRGMVVTVLYRNDGSPKGSFRNVFVDITGDEYYATAAAWAYAENIVTGTGTDEWGDPIFSPDRNITRQELATMFARYAAYKHVKLDNSETLGNFTDADKVASWAADAMKWAVSVSLIKGTGNGSTLSPEGYATRDQFATIIYRFCTAGFNYELYYNSPKAISKYTEPEYPLVKDADIYVAVDGLDTNPGTFEKPLATLEGAVKAVRKLEKTKGGITVAFMAGRYAAPVNLQFTAEDSGTADCPITYCAYGDGPVEFCAGVVLPADQFKPIDEDEKAMFADEFEDSIKKIDLAAYGVDVNSLSNSNAVFAGDTRMDIARWPNKRSDGNDSFIDRSYTTRLSGAEGTITFMSNVKNRLDSYYRIDNMYMYGYYRYDWSASDGKIISYDSETGTVAPFINGYGLYDNHDEYAGHPNPYFYFYNIPNELDRTDEYYIDNTTGTLYVMKPTENYSITLTGLMMSMNGVEHVTFKKLEFSLGTNRVVNVQNSNYIEFNMCKFSHMQEYAMSLYGDNNKVYGCEFIDIGSRAIEISSGDRETLTKGNSVIENCLFDGFGAIVKTGSSAVHARGCGITISHNEMCNGPHSAIFYSEYIWASNYITIEYNYIHDVGIQTSDAGAIYAGRNPAGHGSVIRYNIIADAGRRKNNHNSLGIYLDDGQAGQEIYGNIFYNTANHSVFVNSGRENSIHDNIMISTFDDEIPQVNIGDWNIEPEDKHLPIDTEWVMILELVPFRNELWSAKFPTLAKVLYDATNPDPSPYVGNPDYLRYPSYNSVYDNTVITTQERIDNKNGLSIYTDSAVKFATVIEDFTTYNLETNPGFAEPATGNYTITEGSSLCKIPFDKIGRY